MANHLGYVDRALKGREFFVGQSLSGADIQMSFVGEMAKVFDKLGPYPNLRPGWRACMPVRRSTHREGRGVQVCDANRTSRCGRRCASTSRRRGE